MKQFYVYILASKSRVLYTGMTNDLQRRVYEHKNKLVEGFTSKYNVNRLVYYETTNYVKAAIAREKQIKGLLRAKKIALIEAESPTWRDLSDDWTQDQEITPSSPSAEHHLTASNKLSPPSPSEGCPSTT